MVSVKRKAVPDGGDIQSSKKHKRTNPIFKSPVLKEEESFPRGGASVLTSLEHKQIRVQATEDALFEQTTGIKSANADFDDDENEENLQNGILEAPAKAPRKRSSKSSGGKTITTSKESSIRIEGLGYKRLVPGSLVLGQVYQINRYDIVLALPNNLTGYIPLTSISDKFTEAVEAIAQDEAGEEKDETSQLDLNSLFSLGQYLRAYVTSTIDETPSGKPGRKHIELSIDPSKVNSHLKKADIVVNSMIQASVSSVEDHGLIMNLGLYGTNIRGFMSLKELGDHMNLSKVRDGKVFLCLVTGLSSNGKIIELSADAVKVGNIGKGNFLTDAPSVNSLLPGTAVEILISEVTNIGIAGKVMGMLDMTADLIHAGAATSKKELRKIYKVGTKIPARIAWTLPTAEHRRIGVSLLKHVLSFKSISAPENLSPTAILPISTILDECRVVKVVNGVGLFVKVGVKGVRGFVHISKITDEKIETLSESMGRYKLDSVHKSRIIGYNPMDGLFIVSLEPKVINQQFIRIEDVQVGQNVDGVIERIMIDESGVTGMLVNLADGISGLVPKMHFADIPIQHPERKFKIGSAIKARVLSTHVEKRQLRLTLKKTLINSNDDPWDSYEKLEPGLQAPGTLVKILSTGAVVQFFGQVHGFLPVAEMRESYTEDSTEHFRIGQVVHVRIASLDALERRMTVSCKDPSILAAPQREALHKLEIGCLVEGAVTEKTKDEIVVELSGSGLKALLPFGHLADTSNRTCLALAKKIKVSQVLNGLIVMRKQESGRLVQLSKKPSLVKAAGEGKLLKSFDDVIEGAEVSGFVNNVTPTGGFIEFAAGLSGLLRKTHMPDEAKQLPDFGMTRQQSISCRVLHVDYAQRRFLLTLRPVQEDKIPRGLDGSSIYWPRKTICNPADDTITTMNDFSTGRLTKARIKSIKARQINVELADGVPGRIDVSEVFDSWEDIKNQKYPLQAFFVQQILPVRILGTHEYRNHRFLPITNRDKTHTFELTAKPSSQNSRDIDMLSLHKVKVGSSRLVFVNNISQNYFLWVHLSPNVQGRIVAKHLPDVSLHDDLTKKFPIGSALRVRVINVDVANNYLNLSARVKNANPCRVDEVPKGKEVTDNEEEHDENEPLATKESHLQPDLTQANGNDDQMNVDTDDGIRLPDAYDGSGTADDFPGLEAGGFDWTGGMHVSNDDDSESGFDSKMSLPKKKRRRKAEIMIDKTGDLDTNGPQSTADFERLLMGQPNSSVLWLTYMAFQLQSGEVDKARETAERAIKTINIREEAEKLNVWIALLNLENTYGTDESLEEVFKRACQYNDSEETHEKLISIFIQSEKNDKADTLFSTAIKKFSQVPSMWYNYATFLFDTLGAPERARALLPRAMQSLPSHTHFELTKTFAQLEFNTEHGSAERGRTIFEGLLTTFPKRLDLWNVLLDLEIKQGHANLDQVRRLFERVTSLTAMTTTAAAGTGAEVGAKLKPKQAKFLFKRWLEYEMKEGDAKSQGRVQMKAAEYVKGLPAPKGIRATR